MWKNFGNKRKVAAAIASAGALVATGLLIAPAQATVNEWTLGYTDSTTGTPHFASPGDVIKTTVFSMSFSGTYNGPGATVNCTNVSTTGTAAFSYTVPATVPSALPGNPITIPLDVPTGTITGCTNSVDGGPVDVSFVPGTQWLLTVNAPGTSGSAKGAPYAGGTLTGSIKVPDGDAGGKGNGTVIATATTLINQTGGSTPCIIQGPAVADLTVPGEYDPGTATATNTSTKNFFVDNSAFPGSPIGPLTGIPTSSANCPRVGIQATLQSASVTLSGPSGAVPTAVWDQ